MYMGQWCDATQCQPVKPVFLSWKSDYLRENKCELKCGLNTIHAYILNFMYAVGMGMLNKVISRQCNNFLPIMS